MNFWDKKRVLVAGGTGMIGRAIYRLLGEKNELQHLYSFGSQRADLRDPLQAMEVVNCFQPDLVFNLAGWNGGIRQNALTPGRIFHDNTLIALNLLEACRRHSVTKVVSTVTSCAYPFLEMETNWGDFSWVDKEVMDEKSFLEGPPHESVACHGYARRNFQLASMFYQKQYGLNAVCVCPPTIYGPGDRYDPQRSKVMAGLIQKIVKATEDGDDEVVLWGTGKPLREFMYVDDCATLLCSVMESYNDSSLILNIGTGHELSIAELAGRIAAIADFDGRIKFDTTKPDGQYRKRLDLTRMREILGDFEPTPLDEGIRLAVADYKASLLLAS